MDTVTAFEAKTRFGSILDRVAAGEEILMTRHDKAIARIVPEAVRSSKSVRQAVEGIRALRTRMAARKGFRPLTDAELRSAIDKRRR